MKKIVSLSLALMLAIVCSFGLSACDKKKDEAPKGLWKDAKYTEDKEFGDGDKTVVVKVKADDESVTFTIKTDEATVGAALIEHDLVDGEQGDYGLYIKSVNGITADYDKDKAYWAFYVDGEYATSGVDTTEIDEKAEYSLEYTK